MSLIHITYMATGKTPEDAAKNAARFYAALPDEVKHLASGPKPATPTGGAAEAEFVAKYGKISLRDSTVERLALTGSREEMFVQLMRGMDSGKYYRYSGNNMIMPKGVQPGGNTRRTGKGNDEEPLPDQESGNDVFA